MVGSFSCENVFRNANSLSVAAASGGGGTRKSLPEEIAQVFQEPAFGSTCPALSWARALKTSTKASDMQSVISLLIAVLLQTFIPMRVPTEEITTNANRGMSTLIHQQ